MKVRTLSEASHLSRRLGLGTDYSSIQRLLHKDTTLILDYFWNEGKVYTITPAISSMHQASQLFQVPPKERKPFHTQRQKDKETLINWWLERLHHTHAPLQERMTLFWHNHFPSSMRNIWPQLIYRQNQLFRKYALGSFESLLKHIYKDPAMLIYLNGQQNTKSSPNENFARELLELFTLGEGHYTEQDIVGAARAFTGWHYDYKQDRVRFIERRHDTGIKLFMGKAGKFKADDIINILLSIPRTAEYIIEKFWHHFISIHPPEQQYIKKWGKLFRDTGYHISNLISTMIHSEPFWAEQKNGSLIKSPIEVTIGILREMKLTQYSSYTRLNNINKKMGMSIFYPPDVNGWDEGVHWINNETFIMRKHFIQKIIRDHPAHSVKSFSKEMSVEKLSEWLLAAPAVNLPPEQDMSEPAINYILQDPAYQLR